MTLCGAGWQVSHKALLPNQTQWGTQTNSYGDYDPPTRAQRCNQDTTSATQEYGKGPGHNVITEHSPLFTLNV